LRDSGTNPTKTPLPLGIPKDAAMDEIALSAPPAQRDDGHGGDGSGQRRRGDAATAVVSTATASLADGYHARIGGCETVIIGHA